MVKTFTSAAPVILLAFVVLVVAELVGFGPAAVAGKVRTATRAAG
jgi:hypothetical protein